MGIAYKTKSQESVYLENNHSSKRKSSITPTARLILSNLMINSSGALRLEGNVARAFEIAPTLLFDRAVRGTRVAGGRVNSDTGRLEAIEITLPVLLAAVVVEDATRRVAVAVLDAVDPVFECAPVGMAFRLATLLF